MREMNLNEGTSKGKGADPQNWGNAMLEDEDLDLEEQRAALESFKTAKEIASQTELSSEEEARLLKGPDPTRDRAWIYLNRLRVSSVPSTML
jgi:hypothetical protein